MTLLITGGAGFIGSNFIFYMLQQHPEDRIICVDKLTYAGNLETLAPIMDLDRFRFVKADICDRKTMYQLFMEEHPDVVINFAAESHVDRSIEDPEVFLDTNIKGTAVLMDACRKYGIKRFHQISTDGSVPTEESYYHFMERMGIEDYELIAIKQKLTRYGLLVCNNDEQRDKNLDLVVKYLMEVSRENKKSRPKEVKVPTLRKISTVESYTISRLGRDYLSILDLNDHGWNRSG